MKSRQRFQYPTLITGSLEKIGVAVTKEAFFGAQNEQLSFEEDGNGFHIASNAWTPINSDLTVKFKIKIENPNLFFLTPENDNDICCVASSTSKLTLVLLCHLPGLNIQRVIPGEVFGYSPSSQSLETEITCKFNPAEILGSAVFSIRLYLKETRDTSDIFSHIPGTFLGELYSDTLITGGNLAAFNCKLIDENHGPLWYVESSIGSETELEDPLCENFTLCINRNHPNFKEIKCNDVSISPILFEIMASTWIFLLTAVKDISNKEIGQYPPGSIGSCVSEIWKRLFGDDDWTKLSKYKPDKLQYEVRKRFQDIIAVSH